MEQIVYLDVSMDMPVTVEMSLERALSPVTGMEALSNAQVNAFLFYFLYALELSDNIHITKMVYCNDYSYINIDFQSGSSVGGMVVHLKIFNFFFIYDLCLVNFRN